jgi:hypothetical protein
MTQSDLEDAISELLAEAQDAGLTYDEIVSALEIMRDVMREEAADG